MTKSTGRRGWKKFGVASFVLIPVAKREMHAILHFAFCVTLAIKEYSYNNRLSFSRPARRMRHVLS